jgi:hypothetical protein
MRRLRQKNVTLGAKGRREIRPHYGMPLGMPASGTPALGALAGLGVIWTIAGCFNVNYGNCRITCEVSDDCPRGLMCVMEDGTGRGLCAPPGTTTCPSFPNTDAGADSDAMDGGGEDGADAMDGGDGPDAGGPAPPEVLCHNGSCLPLPAAVRANLVLLLWPSNLPPVGDPVSIWQDQSGKGNHAGALYPAAPPHVIPNGVQLDSSQRGSGFVVLDSPSLDFGSGDFAIIVVAGLASSTTPVSFFRKSDGARENSRQISIAWLRSSSVTGQPQGAVNDTLVDTTTTDIPQPSVGAYALRRTTDHLELRLNEAVLGSNTLPTTGLSTTNADDVYLGVANILGETADSIGAVIAIRGATGSADLNQLLAFLRTVFAAP